MSSTENEEENFVHVEPAEAFSFASKLLVAYGLPEADATIAAGCMVRADLRGVDTHGILRIPSYTARFAAGLIKVRPNISVTRPTPVMAAVDGDDGFGFVVATRAMGEAIEAAKRFGIGLATAKRSNHFGMAASYALQAMDQGMMALIFTNAGRSLPPWGGREAIFGTNPFAAGVPGRNGRVFLLDMSPAISARGRFRRAARRGESIPLGLALDAEGKPTTDPNKALKGVVLPIGGPKGSGLAILMDIFGGLISGAAFAGSVRDQFTDFDAPQNVGHSFIAIRPDLFLSTDDFYARMDTLADRVHACQLAEGFTEVVMPGELEARMELRRCRTGIPYSRGEMNILAEEGRKVGLAPPSWSDTPLALSGELWRPAA